MKPGVVRLAMISIALFLSTGATVQAQTRHCTAALGVGRWAYSYSGTLILPTGPVPAASVGRYFVETSGNFTGTQTRTVGGQTAVETISGTSVINPDCTSRVDVNVYLNGVFQRSAVLALVYDKNQKHFTGIFESLTLPDGTNIPVVITLEGSQMFPKD
ncbi:MAG TPA: hypothetical protein VMH85_10810 [Terriglobales bacterium]|nr:hypothetical protein [Terriglobales bacterium]